MDYETYKATVWKALGQWLESGRDAIKLHAIAQAHGVLAVDIEYMLEDHLD